MKKLYLATFALLCASSFIGLLRADDQLTIENHTRYTLKFKMLTTRKKQKRVETTFNLSREQSKTVPSIDNNNALNQIEVFFVEIPAANHPIISRNNKHDKMSEFVGAKKVAIRPEGLFDLVFEKIS